MSKISEVNLFYRSLVSQLMRLPQGTRIWVHPAFIEYVLKVYGDFDAGTRYLNNHILVVLDKTAETRPTSAQTIINHSREQEL